MFTYKCSRINLNVILLFCIFLIFPRIELLAQQQSYLTLQNILTLSTSVAQPDIIGQVMRYKVDFRLTDWRITAQLVRSGASDALLEAIDNNYFSEPPIRILFRGWYPYNGINIITTHNDSFFIANGNSNNWPGYSTPSALNLQRRRTLMVKVEDSANCTFTDNRKMLRVFAGVSKITIQCADSEFHSQDTDFIISGDGIYRYQIPEEIATNDALQNLGFVFGPNNINNLRISAWFE